MPAARVSLAVGVLFYAGALFGQSPSVSAAERAIAHVKRVAESWVSLIDRGFYGDGWDRTARTFKARIDREEWLTDVREHRATLGKIKSRTFLTGTHVTDPPDSPPGEYVVLEYEVAFEHDSSIRETIIPYLSDDGEWYVAGYFIH
jgi:hypothetical protein